MSRLPPHHIRRSRLTERCRAEQVVVVEAAGGYGKTVLGAELVDVWGAVAIEVLLDEGGVSAQLLTGRLRAAVSRAGFVDAAGAMASVGDDPAGAVDAMIDALADEACAFVIDDGHHATRSAGVLIARIARRLGPTQHLAVLARSLPPGAERLRRAETLALTAADLALRPEETLELCRSGFGLAVTVDEGRLLDAATGGWTAAAVLAASRAKRTDQALGTIAGAGESDARASDSLGPMLDELFVALGPERVQLAQIAPLPLLDRELLTAVTADDGFFDRALALGLPLSRTDRGWWELPGPVRDHLATLGSPDPAALQRAAAHYEQRGEVGTALHMLLGAADVESAAALLAAADLRTVETADVLELLSVIDRIPQGVLDRHPRAMLQVARLCGASALIRQRSRLLERLADVVSEDGAPALRREVDAERAIDVLNGGNPLEALEPGQRILATASAQEQFTRARALSVIGQATYWRRADDGSLPVEILREAGSYLDQAAEIYLRLGYREGASGLAAHRAVWIELGQGRPLQALEILNAGLTLAADRPRRFSRILFFRAQVLTELGRHDECEADLDEVLRFADQLGDQMMVAYVDWQRLIASSLRGDGDATVQHAQQAEANSGDWWQVASGHFLADAADCLDRVGQTALAWEYLERAQSDPQDAERLIAMAECALLARHGDPVKAAQTLAVVHRHGIAPREHWRVTLLGAYAALRRGDAEAGVLAARAFEEAARQGQPQVPLIRERDLTESLLALAVETGLPAARALTVASLPTALAVLGRFELTRGGRGVPIGSGQPAQLLKLVAVSGGRIVTDQAIEALWPEVAPAAGRNRLRTVLGRLREAAGEVLAREGDVLVLGSAVRLDLVAFQQEAREALALGRSEAAAVAIARSAIARYRGELLPHDLYEIWAQEPREATRSTMLDLLDLCAAAAVAGGDLDEARRMVERMVELAPDEDERYLKTASELLEHGSKGAALSVLHRARFTLSKLGVDPSPELLDLERSLAA